MRAREPSQAPPAAEHYDSKRTLLTSHPSSPSSLPLPLSCTHAQANVLPLEKSVIKTLEDASRDTDWVYEQLRQLLGRFMFKDDKVCESSQAHGTPTQHALTQPPSHHLHR